MSGSEQEPEPLPQTTTTITIQKEIIKMDKFEKVMFTITAVIIAGIIALAIWACVECAGTDVDTTLTNTNTIITSTNAIINTVRTVF